MPRCFRSYIRSFSMWSLFTLCFCVDLGIRTVARGYFFSGLWNKMRMSTRFSLRSRVRELSDVFDAFFFMTSRDARTREDDKLSFFPS
jgi:hypothetical protein